MMKIKYWRGVRVEMPWRSAPNMESSPYVREEMSGNSHHGVLSNEMSNEMPTEMPNEMPTEIQLIAGASILHVIPPILHFVGGRSQSWRDFLE